MVCNASPSDKICVGCANPVDKPSQEGHIHTPQALEAYHCYLPQVPLKQIRDFDLAGNISNFTQSARQVSQLNVVTYLRIQYGQVPSSPFVYTELQEQHTRRSPAHYYSSKPFKHRDTLVQCNRQHT